MELDILGKFNNDTFVLWKADAPDCVLNMLKNTQLAESLRVWYGYRDQIKENLGYENYHLQDLIWWNCKFRFKTKKYFFYQNWFDQGIYTLEDLYRGRNFVKTFEDLVIEFDISIKDKRKYSFLMNVGCFKMVRISINTRTHTKEKPYLINSYFFSKLVRQKKVNRVS